MGQQEDRKNPAWSSHVVCLMKAKRCSHLKSLICHKNMGQDIIGGGGGNTANSKYFLKGLAIHNFLLQYILETH